jgi:6-pyruvoyltetrahydropterin/6-carboxytetrahydropterin synthase
MWHVSKSFTFEAAHILPNHLGKCNRLHGHNYEVVVYLHAQVLNDQSMVMDFVDLAHYMASILVEVDHKVLLARHYCDTVAVLDSVLFGGPSNCPVTLPEVWCAVLDVVDTTAEELAAWFYAQLAPQLPMVNRVEVWETGSSMAAYEPEPKPFSYPHG